MTSQDDVFSDESPEVLATAHTASLLTAKSNTNATLQKSSSRSQYDSRPPTRSASRIDEVEVPRSLLRDISPPPRASGRVKASCLQRGDESLRCGNGDEKGNMNPGRVGVKNDQAKSLRQSKTDDAKKDENTQLPSLAAIEAGQQTIHNHLLHFTTHLSKCIRTPPATLSPFLTTHPPASPHSQLPISSFAALYMRSQCSHGHHFVIHQHDHPIAGTHYDLRLQFSATSSVSWAVMYGMPGNACSKRLNRNATETRVHCLWNHLIETASARTGSMLIWDTGEYEVLPYPRSSRSAKGGERVTSGSEMDDLGGMGVRDGGFGREERDAWETMTEPEKLIQSFQRHKIKLRFHGAKLPKSYTLNLRLSKKEIHESSSTKAKNSRRGPARRRKRRKMDDSLQKAAHETSSGSDADEEAVGEQTVVGEEMGENGGEPGGEHSDVDEDETIRATNAYPGASNSIGSIHQRTWYLSLDREASGFVKTRKHPVRWERRNKGKEKGNRDEEERDGFEPFFVHGREVERSVVTGRTANEVLADEGVEGFVGRKGWRAILE
jgi:hypothetical protein